MKKLAKIGLAVGTFAASAQFALAADIKKIPIFEGGIMELISNIIQWILIFAGVIAVMYLVYGGLMYITAGGEAEKASKGRVAITNAIIGIIIIMASFAIYTAVVGTATPGGSAPSTVEF